MSKVHSFIPEYPGIRVDRFTEKRERVPDSLQPQWRDGVVQPGPWEDIALYDDEEEGYAPDSDDEDGLCASSSQQRLDDEFRQSSSSAREASSTNVKPRTSQPILPEVFPHPRIQLLTHIHTDHLQGLSSENNYNGAPIYCSAITKEMLLLLEPGKARQARSRGQAVGKRPYAWLRRTQEESEAKRRQGQGWKAPCDYLHVLELNQPTEVSYTPGRKVTITLLDSNHMSGSSMFLIEGHRGAVLHMGDCRAEISWLDALRRQPSMRKYCCWQDEADSEDQGGSSLPGHMSARLSNTVPQQPPSRSETEDSGASDAGRSRGTAITASSGKARRVDRVDLRLQRVIIDEEWIDVGGQPPGKEEATRDLVELIQKYPKDTILIIDDWTFGYEDVYVAVGRMLQSIDGTKIHVDGWKFNMYKAAYEAGNEPCFPFLTTEAGTTRTHACDLTDKCEHLQDDDCLQRASETEAYKSLSQRWHGPAVQPFSQEEIQSLRESAAAERAAQAAPSPVKVLIRIIEASQETWAELRAKLLAEIEKAERHEGPWPVWLACPIQRHTTLPELQQFVRAFRPRNITPQSSDLDKHFLVTAFLGPYLDEDGRARVEAEAKEAMGLEEWERCEEALRSSVGGSGSESQQRTQAQQLQAFRAARSNQTKDSSQESGKRSRKRKHGQEKPQQSGGSSVEVGAELT